MLLKFEIVKGLILKTNFGYNNASNSQKKLSTIVSQNPASSPKGIAQFGNNFNKGWIVEPQIEYNSFISKGRFSLLLGASSQSANTEGILTTGSGYASDLLLNSVSNAPVKSASENYGEYKYAAIFARVNYNWQNKYLVNLNLRRDGSSRFGEGKQFGNFGSVGAAWVFSEEKLFKKHSNVFSFGKVRISYGTTGSDAIGDYQYLTRWGSTLASTYNGYSSLLPTQHANPDFQWQVNKKFESAIDLAFLRERIAINIAYYINRCNNQLISIVLPSYTGFNKVVGNWPAEVQNKGLEVSASGKIINTKDIVWSVSFNIAFNRNKLVAYPNFDQSPYANTLEIGKSINIVKLLRYTGIDQTTGLYTFEDKNNDGVIDRTASSPVNDLNSYDRSPKYSGGFQSSWQFRSLQLSLFFSYIKQIGVNALYATIPGTFSSGIGNVPVDLLNRWQKPGDASDIARFTTTGSDPSFTNFYNYSNGIYTDASFIRLTNASLSYSLPTIYTKKAGLEGCSIFLNAQNLFTITNYKGIDPETQSFGSLPPTKTIVAGISFNF
jgi:TonB-linked SusC/RagA family outer membrane protein